VVTAFGSDVAGLGLTLDEGQLAAFGLYRDLILEAAARFNLTAVREAREIERRHFLEALCLGQELARLDVIAPMRGCRVIDIGSGAGLPGIPLKIAWPRLEMSLLESNEKRCRFLREAIQRLGLDGVAVLEGRAEVWGRDAGHRDRYDLAVARAVAPLPVLLEYALPFVREGGRLAAQKGSAAPREIAAAGAALTELRGEVEYSGAFEPPGGPRQTLLLVRKLGTTPQRYPRRPGIPAKRPIA
jgi:16S rRNA (guanine527-N7)-methyltransferase